MEIKISNIIGIILFIVGATIGFTVGFHYPEGILNGISLDQGVAMLSLILVFTGVGFIFGSSITEADIKFKEKKK